jgi:carbon-monoxide dehydrogenase medium subunit
MYPASFEYLSPYSLDEAADFLDKHAGEARVLAGGHSLIPLMKLRLLRPAYVVDLGKLKELRYIKADDENIRVGALTTYYELETSPIIKKNLYLLSEGASVVGDPQVRNWGTLGGSLSHCDPAGDMGACCLALRAKMIAKSVAGERIIESDQWFVDTFQSALKPNEILREIVFPKPKPNSGGAYLKLERKAGDYATAAVAAQLSVDNAGTCTYAGLGLTAVASTSMRATKAEAALLGRVVDDKVIEEAAQVASEECKPTDDPLRGSAEYKKAMVKVFTKRAMKQALQRTKNAE